MDYERLLCSTGPYQGEVLRASDGRHPRSIAWIQCVGSRQVVPGANSYCSAVCCTYTQKQVIVTKDHDAGVECTVFHNDIRSYGKDFERFFERTNNLPGVRFIRSYVSIVREDPVTKNVTVRYATPDGVKEEEFDLVVLAVGIQANPEVAKLFEDGALTLDPYFYVQETDEDLRPGATSIPGVFVAGTAAGAKDIPDTILHAGAAVAQAAAYLERTKVPS